MPLLFMPERMNLTNLKLSRQKKKTTVLIVGMGDAGKIVAKEIKKHPELNYDLKGFIDDDPLKQKRGYLNCPVFDTIENIPKVVQKEKIDQIIIAIPSASGQVIRRIISQCEKTSASFKILPGVYEILDSLKSGKAYFKSLRDVRMEDLLRRKPILINLSKISSFLAHKVILITGAAGSIGSELARQVSEFDLKKLILLDHNENSLYELELELREKKTSPDLEIEIGDIKDKNKMFYTIKKHSPDIIYHAAAHKHVPLMEHNPEEAVKNNIFGTKNLAEAAHKYRVKEFILISTDKAVNPTSVMGVSKRIAEMLMRSIQKHSKTKFISVRFGNVLGSAGSVIPLFKKQIEKGGPVTITHPKMIRFFMTIPEAVQLVIQASAMDKEGGYVYILDMGKQYKILDLAKDLIRLMGFKPYKDVPIVFTGIRPGEKIYEEIMTKQEGVTATKNKRIYILKPNNNININRLNRDLKNLEILAKKADRKNIIKKLKKMIPDFHYK